MPNNIDACVSRAILVAASQRTLGAAAVITCSAIRNASSEAATMRLVGSDN
jgi:hypothetical protein